MICGRQRSIPISRSTTPPLVVALERRALTALATSLKRCLALPSVDDAAAQAADNQGFDLLGPHALHPDPPDKGDRDHPFLVHLLAPMLLSIALIVAAARDTFSHQMV